MAEWIDEQKNQNRANRRIENKTQRTKRPEDPFCPWPWNAADQDASAASMLELVGDKRKSRENQLKLVRHKTLDCEGIEAKMRGEDPENGGGVCDQTRRRGESFVE